MKTSNYRSSVRRAILFCLLCVVSLAASADYNTEKVIYVYKGNSFTISPWADSKSYYSGYSVAGTSVDLSDTSALTQTVSSTTATTYPGYDGSREDGSYSTYRITANKVGIYYVIGYAACKMLEGNTLTGQVYHQARGCILYHVVVTEKPTVTSIVLPSSIVVNIGASYTLSPVLAAEGSSSTLTWTSGDKSIFTVSSSGVVKGVAAGKATLTCKAANGIKTTCTVTVKTVPVTAVSLNASEISLTKDETYSLTATVAPTTATNTAVTWTSSDTNVATVTTKGKVTAVAAGTSVITCTASDGSGKQATCLVKVNDTASNACDINKNGNVTVIDLAKAIDQLQKQ